MTVRDFGSKRVVSPPDIDDLLDEVTFSAGEIDLEAAKIVGGDHVGAVAQGRIRRSEVTSVNLAESRIGPITLADTVFRGVDLSNAEWLSITARRAEFINCRATGWRATFEVLQDLYVESCNLQYSLLTLTRAKGTSAFKDCVFRNAMINGDLSNVVFRDCTFVDVEFLATGAKGCDLTGSRFEGSTGIMSLRGATMSADQVATLAEQLANEAGLIVKS